VNLADIVNQSKSPPLHIHLGLGAQGESIQLFLNADIGKHRLDDAQASGRMAEHCLFLNYQILVQYKRLWKSGNLPMPFPF
jgi:hypothetical protein